MQIAGNMLAKKRLADMIRATMMVVLRQRIRPVQIYDLALLLSVRDTLNQLNLAKSITVKNLCPACSQYSVDLIHQLQQVSYKIVMIKHLASINV